MGRRRGKRGSMPRKRLDSFSFARTFPSLPRFLPVSGRLATCLEDSNVSSRLQLCFPRPAPLGAERRGEKARPSPLSVIKDTADLKPRTLPSMIVLSTVISFPGQPPIPPFSLLYFSPCPLPSRLFGVWLQRRYAPRIEMHNLYTRSDKLHREISLSN